MGKAAKYLALASLVGFSAQSPALTILPTYTGAVDSTLQSSVSSAIQTIGSIFTGTNITVNIDFQLMDTGLGASLSGRVTPSYSEFRTALANTTTTSIGTLAVSHLPTSSNNPVLGSGESMSMTTANARAIGLTADPRKFVDGAFYDGIVYINTSAGSFDYVSVVEHEINEVLGLGSAMGAGTTALPNVTMPEDLYRYNANGTRSFSLSSSELAYFSVDGTVTSTSPQFNQDGTGDYGDWCSASPSNCTSFGYYVQNAYATRSRTIPYGTPEINALEAIGYNIAAVPLPPAAYLLATAMLGLVIRGRRREAA